MPNDQEYLAKAGISEETATPVAETPAAATEQPQTAQEMFELAGNKFPVNTEFQILRNGQIEKVPYSNLLNTYRQASHINDKWAKWKPQVDEFQKLKPEFEKYKGFYDKFGQFQEWSEKNPKDWEALHSIYQNRDRHLLEAQVQPNAQAQVNPNLKPFVDEIAALKQELGGLKNFKETFEQKQQREAEERDATQVQGEVVTFQKEYPEINLEERDPDGVTLWAKIMNYGIQSKLPDFESAALKFLKSRLQDTWSSRARNEAVKGIKDQTRQGIIQRSATPITGQAPVSKIDPKRMSLGQLAEYAKENISAFSNG